MLWEKWIPKKYLVKSTICGLEIMITEGGYKYFYSIITTKKNKLEITESGTGENDLVLPPKIKKDNIPLIISFVGKGLILKKVQIHRENNDPENILSQNLPAIDKNDFYIQLYHQNQSNGYLSIFRKDYLANVLGILQKSKYDIAEIFMGYSFIADVIPLTNLFNKVVTNNATIEISEFCIDEIRIGETPENSEITLDGLSLNKHNIIAFSLCFIYLLNIKNHFNFPGYPDHRPLHTEKNKFRFLSRAAVFSAFALCLINYLFFNYYFRENQKLQSELDHYEGKYQQINELLSSYEEKRHLIEETGILNKEKIALRIDKIASTIPKDLILTDWKINPMINNDEDSLLRFQKNNLFIKGNCDKSLLVNEWIHVLKSLDFVKKVNMENFFFRNEGNLPNFELKIEIE